MENHDSDLIVSTAKLARLRVSDESHSGVVEGFEAIVKACENLQKIEVDLQGEIVEPKSRDDLRPDQVLSQSGQKEALTNAPLQAQGHFRVPPVL